MKRFWKLEKVWYLLFGKISFLDNGVDILNYCQWALGKNLQEFELRFNKELKVQRYPTVHFTPEMIFNGKEIGYLKGYLQFKDGECSFIFVSGVCISVSLVVYYGFTGMQLVFFYLPLPLQTLKAYKRFLLTKHTS